MSINQDDAIAHNIPMEVEECPLCIESGISAMTEEILAASQIVGPTLTAEEFSQSLNTEFPTSGD